MPYLAASRFSVLSLVAATLLGVSGCDPEQRAAGTGTGTSGSDDESDDASGGEGGADGGGNACTPPSDGFQCKTDDDCQMYGDCCSCVAFNPNMGSPGNCGGSCEQNTCDAIGATGASCVAGYCRVDKPSCITDEVICDAIPPECAAGSVPSYANGCYTGDCMPVEQCEAVPGCEVCGEGQLCMHETRDGCDQFRCINPIEECQGQPTCACTGSIYCSNGGTCVEEAEGFRCE